MSGRDWDSEMRKIDRQLESVSDEAMLPARGTKSPAARAQAESAQRVTSTFGVFARLSLAVVLGIAILFWPYSARCGAGLAMYLASVGTLITAGVWSAVWTWRHRSAGGHSLALLLVMWGLVLAAMDVLPRVGYARPTAAHPALWTCS